MTTLLRIDASLNGPDSRSAALTGAFLEHYMRRHPGARVISHDLASEEIPHLDARTFGAFATPPERRSDEQRQRVAPSDRWIEELRSADLLVLGAPMYNFGVPSPLKAWMDHVARAGVTFRYTESGPEGLLTGTRAVVAATRGGRYAGTPADSQTPFLRTFLNFLGIADVEFVHAEGLAMDETTARRAMLEATTRMQQLAECMDPAAPCARTGS